MEQIKEKNKKVFSPLPENHKFQFIFGVEGD